MSNITTGFTGVAGVVIGVAYGFSPAKTNVLTMMGRQSHHVSGSLMGCCLAGITHILMNKYMPPNPLLSNATTLLMGIGSIMATLYVKNPYMQYALYSMYAYNMFGLSQTLLTIGLDKLNLPKTNTDARFKLLLCFLLVLMTQIFTPPKNYLSGIACLNGIIASLCS